MQKDAEKQLIALVEDDPECRYLLVRWLEHAGFRVQSYERIGDLLAELESASPGAVCVDLGLPDGDGLDYVSVIRERSPTTAVVVITGDVSVERVVAAMRLGAFDYVGKPLDRTRVVTTLRNALDREALARAVKNLTSSAKKSFQGIVGASDAMLNVFREIEVVAVNDINTLVHGESGTGKELVARAIHDTSPRSSHPFIAVNCAALPDSLLESELFGHEKGAFTGASAARAGRIEQAHRGTLFLDEVAELSLAAQAKLLRAIQEKTIQRVGGNAPRTVDFRLVAATHKDLADEVVAGRFREDLFYRLAVFELELPALRDREDDIELLSYALVARHAKAAGNPVPEIAPETLDVLRRHRWPGNVRELDNVLQRALIVARDGCIRPQSLPARVLRGESYVGRGPHRRTSRPSFPSVARRPSSSSQAASTLPGPAKTLADQERAEIERVFNETNGSRKEMIRRLGIGRTTLYRKLRQFGLG